MQQNSTNGTAAVKGGGPFWKSAAKEFKRVTSITGAGLLAALGIVIKSFTITISQVLRINFSFLAIAISGFLYGPLVAGTMGVVVDILGYFVAGGGPFFFGFTLNAFINGIIYGCWLYKKPVKVWRCFGAVLTAALIVNLMLNPLWLSMMYGEAFLVLLAARLLQNAVLLPVNTALLYLLLRVLERAKIRR